MDRCQIRNYPRIGMNAEELEYNENLSDWCVHNLNTHSDLPYPDACFDRILLAVSIQYLIQPIAAFQYMAPQDRIKRVMAYLSAAGFADVEFVDRSPPNAGPLWLVVGRSPATS